MGIRSILGGSSRVRKSTKKSAPKKPAPSPSPSSSSSWAASLPRRKPGAAPQRKRSKADRYDDGGHDLFDDKLDDFGLVRALGADLNLRDTSQALLYIRSHMFSPMPEQAAGMGSARIAEVLNYRKHLPPIVTVSHAQTLLASPSAVEREVAELARAGFLRKVVVARRGGLGETVVLSVDLERMVRDSAELEDETKDRLVAFLRANPGTQAVGRDALGGPAAVASLVRAGFLTAHHLTGVTHHGAMSGTMNVHSRPEDRSTLTSLASVSRQPTGSLGAVGGGGAVHAAGGSGGGSLSMPSNSSSANDAEEATSMRLAVPGTGAFLKLASEAVDHLVSLLRGGESEAVDHLVSLLRGGESEAPESALRARWDGGIARGEENAQHAARRARGEFVGVLPGRTRKWRLFYGLAFDWVLREAVGAGRVEVFETRSVGRGVRAL
ncbi:serine-threonine protein kinase 19-domain-containing protein [Hypoxylon sp. FL1284]|nr:serine-threonine protein kinase 19-domain-containing protein [Hypoxylon sp. FL1284]